MRAFGKRSHEKDDRNSPLGGGNSKSRTWRVLFGIYANIGFTVSAFLLYLVIDQFLDTALSSKTFPGLLSWAKDQQVDAFYWGLVAGPLALAYFIYSLYGDLIGSMIGGIEKLLRVVAVYGGTIVVAVICLCVGELVASPMLLAAGIQLPLGLTGGVCIVSGLFAYFQIIGMR